MGIPPFHLAIPVYDLEESRDFYGGVLGCPEGRSDTQWIDYNLYGHQLVVHCTGEKQESKPTNSVDSHNVPVPHFGVVLSMEDWQSLADKLRKAEVSFIIEPYIRFEGEVGEQATMFFQDPSGNALEFKAFKNLDQLFAK